MSITNKTTKQETLIRKDELNKNTFKVTVNTDDINILTTTNGITTFTSENYIDGIQLITQVPEPKLQTKVVNITQNGTYEIKPDDDLDALESVIVGTNVPQYKIDSLSVYKNGVITLVTLAPEIISVKQYMNDLKDLIPEVNKLYRVKNESGSTAQIYASDAESNYQYIIFYTDVVKLNINELNSKATGTIVYNGGIRYVLKTEGNSINDRILLCNGTELSNLTPIITYYPGGVSKSSADGEKYIFGVTLEMISENFPIQ
ncbi:hypothetical protein ENUP19_0051G0050 [Entamoeba nuttalli]|uniref:Uncharacterized protein n=1 Tax=Entamoeba nuttalli TaxID=412467 RepID=A0ABQ0DBW9_9EUKA